MRTIILTFLLGLGTQLMASDPQSYTPKVKIYKNDLQKIYTVFFADTLERKVQIDLLDSRGNVIMNETQVGKGFLKNFGLSSLSNGEYQFVINYGDGKITEKIELMSEKEVLARSVTIKVDYPSLTINITKDDLSPINIFIYNKEDEVLKNYYWEPSENMLTKTMNISEFEIYEARIQVVQSGKEKLDQLIDLY